MPCLLRSIPCLRPRSPVYHQRQFPRPVHRFPDYHHAEHATASSTWDQYRRPVYPDPQPYGFQPEPAWLRNPPRDYIADPWRDWAQDDIFNPPRRTHIPEWHNPLSTRSNVLPPQQSGRQSSHPSTPLQIDALLRSNPSGDPALAWDIIDPPDRAQRTLDRLFALPSFDNVATTPRCTRIQIKYDHPTFGSLVNGFGPINVFSVLGDSHVLLRDVLKAIYLHFQQPITGEEWASLSVPERNHVSRYQAARFRDRRHLYYNAAQTPVIRGDFLRECTVFSGLHIESCLGSSCVLRMDLLPLNPSNDLR